MTPLERRSLVRSDGKHTEALLLSRLDRADSTSSLPLATDRARPEDSVGNELSVDMDYFLFCCRESSVCECCTCNSGQRSGVDEAASALNRL